MLCFWKPPQREKSIRNWPRTTLPTPKGWESTALFLRPSQGDLIPAPQMEPSLLLSGRYRPITLEGRNLFATRDFYAFFKHLGGDGH